MIRKPVGKVVAVVPTEPGAGEQLVAGVRDLDRGNRLGQLAMAAGRRTSRVGERQ